MDELSLLDTTGILRRPWIRPGRTSAGLGWSGLSVSTRREQPYRAAFAKDPETTLGTALRRVPSRD